MARQLTRAGASWGTIEIVLWAADKREDAGTGKLSSDGLSLVLSNGKQGIGLIRHRVLANARCS
jgi:hypothetical protein